MNRKTTSAKITYEQTEAQWLADTRKLDVNVEGVCTDGPDQGKHKAFTGLHTWAELNYLEDGGGVAAPAVTLNGVTQSGIAAFTGTTDGSGNVTFDFTALIPGVASVSCIGTGIVYTPGYITLVDPTLSAYTLNLSDGSVGVEAEPITITVMYKLS